MSRQIERQIEEDTGHPEADSGGAHRNGQERTKTERGRDRKSETVCIKMTEGQMRTRTGTSSDSERDGSSDREN